MDRTNLGSSACHVNLAQPAPERMLVGSIDLKANESVGSIWMYNDISYNMDQLSQVIY